MRKRLKVALLCAVLASAMVVAAPAQALNEWLCEGVGDYHFSDVAADSPHWADINCLRSHNITAQVGTFDPYGAVSRWQMALFLTRTFSPLYLEDVPWTNPGFTDIGALPLGTQRAISQVWSMSVTSGTTSTTFSPYESVTRWQMALFLTRLLQASGIEVPAATDQGFVDIQSLSAEAQAAINQVKQLGITSGTSATTYSPNQLVTRQQMATFLVRTLMATTETHFPAEDCTPPRGDSLPGQATVCVGTGTDVANRPFLLRRSWNYYPNYPIDLFLHPGTRIEILIDGVVQPAAERIALLNAVYWKHYVVVVPGLTGVHTIETRWIIEGDLVITDLVEVTYS
jgi:peptidoglycan hydrolase-like protein with peptidoglycan-binding domain